ncbi:MAG: glycoside hydrolase family 1 protein [Candidatus Omnitrophica bacterium]|nr:glycoside hydrolase family 1 protein [Candidatus Omnitrophota bacterium]MDD5592241.1 glycoside hydrolase family 1 protein [Candidatus Omnitrophota bacterium]
MIQFPKDFFWGAATSSYQVEGNNINSDWWEWEKRVGLRDASGQACRHYEFYKEDFALAASLNHNCHRLSIEWSRIEPREGEFSASEIQRYKEVILSLKANSLEPVVTLHHFTNPLWFAKLGGWQNKKSGFYFLRYVDKVVRELAPGVRYWVTINEPLVYAYHAYILGVWPPQEKSILKANRVQENLIRAHIETYRLIRRIYEDKSLNYPLISIAKNTQAFVACIPTLRNKIAVYLRNRYYNLDFVERLLRAKTLDFIGINYYSRSLVETQGWGIRNLTMDVCQGGHSCLKKNSMGWDIYPEGLYSVLLEFKKYNLPLFILENGVCTDDDNLRWDFIYAHLKNLHLAIQAGAPLLGYIYWSLIDNFEWDKGFAPRFGLIEIDYHTYRRTVRESAKRLSLVCKTGRLE